MILDLKPDKGKWYWHTIKANHYRVVQNIGVGKFKILILSFITLLYVKLIG